jgi:pSer/pThr/pTyr-binding forkhead associated (FHA) protein
MSDDQKYHWYLESKLKDNSPWIIPVNKQEFVIGRSETCDLILNNATVSRRHSCIFFDFDEPYIKDLQSQNGTFVNGAPVQTDVRLRPADIIKIGPVNLTLRSSEIQEEESSGTIIEKGDKIEKSFAEFYQISKREYDVLYLLIMGKSIKEIADKLYISKGTAKNHSLNIYKKTNCHSRIELANLFREFQDGGD